MGEVGVNPDRVAQAATALEQLRDALSANVPVIVNTLNSYWSGGTGTQVSLSVLTQATGRAPGDAAGMRTRARLAALWLQQNVSLTGTGLVSIPFSGPALDNADAHAEAQALAAAEASPDPEAAMAAIQAIHQDLKDHLTANDTVWLSAFYDQAAPQVAALAATLHRLGAGSNPAQQYASRFTVLTPAGQQIMAAFGQGLAAADKSQPGLSPQAVQAIANAPDAWSAAMLVKYGPPGSSWATNEKASPQNPDGLSLLALLTSHVYQAEQNGTLRIPLGGGYSRYGLPDREQLAQVLASNDPIQVMLQADAQNKNASWQVMGGPNGRALAQMLLNSVNGDLPGLDGRFVQGAPNDRGQFPGYFTMVAPGQSINFIDGQVLPNSPSQPAVAAFLDAATSGPRGSSTDARYSAWAAVNIITSTPSPNGDSGITEDPSVQQALLHTAQRYLLDLAESTTYSGGSGTVLPFDSQPGNPYVIEIPGEAQGSGTTALSSFLQQIMSSPAGGGVLTASVKTAMGNYYAIRSTAGFPPGGPASPDLDMASLLGRIGIETGNVHLSQAQQQDAQNAETNAMIDFGQDAVTWVPVVGDYAGKAESLAKLFGVPMHLSTNNAATVQQAGQHNFAIQETQINVPMVQALINAHAIPGSALDNQQDWLRNGTVVLTGDKSISAFTSWWNANNNRHDLANWEARYQHQMEVQQATSAQQAGGGSGG